MTKLFNKRSDLEKRRKLRNNATSAEKFLWELIRCRQVGGARFRRQYSVRGFVLDFYCPISRLAIELDGDVHEYAEQKIYDKERQRLLECVGIRFLRFTNDEVFSKTGSVLKKIEKVLNTPSVSPPCKGGEDAKNPLCVSPL